MSIFSYTKKRKTYASVCAIRDTQFFIFLMCTSYIGGVLLRLKKIISQHLIVISSQNIMEKGGSFFITYLTSFCGRFHSLDLGRKPRGRKHCTHEILVLP